MLDFIITLFVVLLNYSKVIAPTGQTPTHAPQEMQTSGST